MLWPVRALSDPTLCRREIFRFREADGGQASPLQALEAPTLRIFDFGPGSSRSRMPNLGRLPANRGRCSGRIEKRDGSRKRREIRNHVCGRTDREKGGHC